MERVIKNLLFSASRNVHEEKKMTSIMIVDSELFVREGIKHMLAACADLQIVSEAHDSQQALQQLGKCRPDLVIVEIAMAEHCGVGMVRELKNHAPHLKILVMSYRRESDFALRCMRAGASGFIRKDCCATELTCAVRVVANGRPYVSETVSELLASSIIESGGQRLHDKLSDSDFEIFCLIASGTSTARVADIFHVSIAAVRSRRSKMMDRMYLRTTADVVEYAVKNDLIERTYRS
jgi:two-component system invasion response regulator UvrY